MLSADRYLLVYDFNPICIIKEFAVLKLSIAFFSPIRRLYPSGCSPLRDGVEPDASIPIFQTASINPQLDENRPRSLGVEYLI